jgi:hypothetical protein
VKADKRGSKSLELVVGNWKPTVTFMHEAGFEPAKKRLVDLIQCAS